LNIHFSEISTGKCIPRAVDADFECDFFQTPFGGKTKSHVHNKQCNCLSLATKLDLGVRRLFQPPLGRKTPNYRRTRERKMGISLFVTSLSDPLDLPASIRTPGFQEIRHHLILYFVYNP
jgi:hypothetical protein